MPVWPGLTMDVLGPVEAVRRKNSVHRSKRGWLRSRSATAEAGVRYRSNIVFSVLRSQTR